jgi:GxxExxY protein
LKVHRRLGPGLLESIYGDALAIELDYRKIPFEREWPVSIYYRDQLLRVQRIDMVVMNQILLELKAVERLALVHQAQVISYLRASQLRIGLLINFNSDRLKGSIIRIIL